MDCSRLASLYTTISQSLPKFISIASAVMPFNTLIFVTPFFYLQYFPSLMSFPISWQFASDGQSIRDSASVAESNDYSNDYFWADFQWLYWLVWSLCCPRNSQESSPAPQFKSINSTVFCHLYGPAQASICEYRKDHSLEYKDICWRSGVCFSTHVYISQSFSAKKYSFSNLMAGVILEHKRENMSLLSIFPLIFAMEWWDWVLWLEFS